jgi:hypothetical protein
MVNGRTVDNGRTSLEMRQCVFGKIEVRMNIGVESVQPLLSVEEDQK